MCIKFLSILVFISLLSPSVDAKEKKKVIPETGRINISSSKEIDFLLTNPDGLQTGRDPVLKKDYEKIPGGFYERDFPMESESDSEEFKRPVYRGPGKIGLYRLKVFGVLTGAYRLDTYLVINGGADNSTVSGKIKKGEIQNFVFEHTAGGKFKKISGPK